MEFVDMDVLDYVVVPLEEKQENKLTLSQKHLRQCIKQYQQTIEEIKTSETDLVDKKVMATKLQGVIEYLQQIGTTLPEPPKSKKKKLDT
jgi:NADH:ubiquinone oxidoreductase subunit D